MVGYDGWTMERFTMSESIPLLADGIKWLGYSRKHGFLWNIGYFNDVVSKGQSFSSYSSQEVVRLAWLPVQSEEEGTLFSPGLQLPLIQARRRITQAQVTARSIYCASFMEATGLRRG
jgi:phosphate-selective porin OprO and OprP